MNKQKKSNKYSSILFLLKQMRKGTYAGKVNKKTGWVASAEIPEGSSVYIQHRSTEYLKAIDDVIEVIESL